MTVCEIDSMAAESIRQRPRTRRRKGSMDPEVLDGDSCTLQLPREPAIAIRWKEDDVVVASRLKFAREIGNHAFGATWTVRLDQMRETQG